MRLGDYLAARNESQETFAKRAPDVRPRAVRRVVRGAVPRADTALAIIRASEAAPAPDGGTVSLEDLVPAATRERMQEELGCCYRDARQEIGAPGAPTAVAACAPDASGALADDDLRPAAIAVVNELYTRSLITATGGNVSVRLPGHDALWITPSQIFKGELRPELMVRIDLQGRPLDPAVRAPSSERLIHCAIYRARPEANAVIHAHPPHATILANTDLPFLPISAEAARVGNISRVPFIMPGSEDLAKAVGEAAADNWAVLMKNHGLIVAGRSLRRAADAVEIIERTAEVILGCYAVGREPPTLPDAALQTFRRCQTPPFST